MLLNLSPAHLLCPPLDVTDLDTHAHTHTDTHAHTHTDTHTLSLTHRQSLGKVLNTKLSEEFYALP